MNVPFKEIVQIKGKNPYRTYSLWEVAEIISSRYEWEEFRELDPQIPAEWLASIYGWDADRFTETQVNEILQMASNRGYHFD